MSLISIVIIISTLLGGWGAYHLLNRRGRPGRKQHALPPFSGLSLHGAPARVVLSQVEAPLCRLAVPAHNQHRITFEVRAEHLYVHVLQPLTEHPLYLSVANLRELRIHGAIQLQTPHSLQTERIRIIHQGEEEVSLLLASNHLESVLLGRGKLILAGRTNVWLPQGKVWAIDSEELLVTVGKG